MLTRNAFCQLCRLTSEGLKSLSRRDQLPFNARSPDRERDTYSLFEAFVTILADDLSSGGEKSVAVAMRMVSALAPALADSWPAILETGQRLAHGEKVREEVLCVQAFRSSDTPDRPFELHVCGATEKVLDNLAAHRPLTRATIGNASRAAMALVSRAMHFGIELPEDLAAEPPTYHPYGTQTVEQTGGEEA